LEEPQLMEEISNLPRQETTLYMEPQVTEPTQPVIQHMVTIMTLDTTMDTHMEI